MADCKETVADQLAAILNAATQDDLVEVDRRIEGHRKQITTLEKMRRLIEMQVNGDVPRHGKKTGPKPKQQPSLTSGGTTPPPNGSAKGATFDAYRQKCANYLFENGATKQSMLSAACGIPNGSIVQVLDHHWFTKNDQGVHVTPLARRDLL